MNRPARTSVAIGLLLVATAPFALTRCVSDASSSSTDDDASTAHDDGSGGGGGDANADGGGGGQDGASGDDASSGGDGDAAPIDPCIGAGGASECPDAVSAAHLQLWLEGDRGIACNAGRVTTWPDQSGKGRNATQAVRLDGGLAAAPQCGVATINARPVVSFTAPPNLDDGGNSQFVDETMRVDMSFLGNSAYTIFAVERRSSSDGEDGLLANDGTTHASLACFLFMGVTTPDPGSFFLLYGQEGDAGPLLAQSPRCTVLEGRTVDFAAGAPANLDVFWFSPTVGRQILVNGAVIAQDSQTTATTDAGVAQPVQLGRTNNSFYEGRYKGQIAEIVAFDAALDSTALGHVSAYLKRKWATP